MAKILIVEDEKNMREIIADYMRRGGHSCFTAEDGVEALMVLKNGPVDLMILDIMMPHLDGFSVCRAARQMSSLPIILLTAKSSEEDKLKGYELGADDYITKPFSPRLLLAKVNALLRRFSVCQAADMHGSNTVPAAGSASSAFTADVTDTAGSARFAYPTSVVTGGTISIFPAARKVFLEGQEITLTYKEYELLFFLMSNPGQIFSREQLLNRIWGYDFEGITRTVDTHIKTLRHKLGGEGRHIITLIRSGYKFEVTP